MHLRTLEKSPWRSRGYHNTSSKEQKGELLDEKTIAVNKDEVHITADHIDLMESVIGIPVK